MVRSVTLEAAVHLVQVCSDLRESCNLLVVLSAAAFSAVLVRVQRGNEGGDDFLDPCFGIFSVFWDLQRTRVCFGGAPACAVDLYGEEGTDICVTHEAN